MTQNDAILDALRQRMSDLSCIICGRDGPAHLTDQQPTWHTEDRLYFDGRIVRVPVLDIPEGWHEFDDGSPENDDASWIEP